MIALRSWLRRRHLFLLLCFFPSRILLLSKRIICINKSTIISLVHLRFFFRDKWIWRGFRDRKILRLLNRYINYWSKLCFFRSWLNFIWLWNNNLHWYFSRNFILRPSSFLTHINCCFVGLVCISSCDDVSRINMCYRLSSSDV